VIVTFNNFHFAAQCLMAVVSGCVLQKSHLALVKANEEGPSYLIA